MGTTFDRRLTKVALSLGLCPRHGDEVLRCVRCDFEEDRLPPEQDAELTGYLERLRPVLHPLPVWDRCLRCRDFSLVCLRCCAETSGEEKEWGALSEAESARCIDLLDRVNFRLRGTGEPGIPMDG